MVAGAIPISRSNSESFNTHIWFLTRAFKIVLKKYTHIYQSRKHALKVHVENLLCRSLSSKSYDGNFVAVHVFNTKYVHTINVTCYFCVQFVLSNVVFLSALCKLLLKKSKVKTALTQSSQTHKTNKVKDAAKLMLTCALLLSNHNAQAQINL